MKQCYSTVLLAIAIAMPATAQHIDHRSLHQQPNRQVMAIQNSDSYQRLHGTNPWCAEAQQLGTPAWRANDVNATKNVWLCKHYVTTNILERPDYEGNMSKSTTVRDVYNTYNTWGKVATQLSLTRGATTGIYNVYIYDDNGVLTERKEFNYDVATKANTLELVSTYAYDQDGNQTEELQRKYNSETGEYTNVSRIETLYTKMSPYFPAVYAQYSWNSETNSWQEEYKEVNTRTNNEAGVINGITNTIYLNAEKNLSFKNDMTYSADVKPTIYRAEQVYYAMPGETVGFDADRRSSMVNRENIVVTDYNVDFSQSDKWNTLDFVLGDNYQCDRHNITSYMKGTECVQMVAGGCKETHTSKYNNGLLSYTHTEDSRSGDGQYTYEQCDESDEWGSCVLNIFKYSGLGANETPSDAKLKGIEMMKLKYTSKDSYTLEWWYSADNTAPQPLKKTQEEWRTINYNNTGAYIVYDERGNIYYTDDVYTKTVNTTEYLEFEQFTINAINSITTDGSGEQVRRVYNTSGVCVGTTTDNLPSGLYIVREGSRTYKMLKK